MTLRIEDLEHELKNRNVFENESVDGASSISTTKSTNLIQHSMKQAIKAAKLDENTNRSTNVPQQYEKMIQKLEGDIRQHFKVSLSYQILQKFKLIW